jgi:hypothetical protein
MFGRGCFANLALGLVVTEPVGNPGWEGVPNARGAAFLALQSFFASVAGKSSRALRKSGARARRVDRALERRVAPLQWPRRPPVAVFQHAAARLLVGLAVPTAAVDA